MIEEEFTVLEEFKLELKMEWKEFIMKMRGAGYVDLYIYKPLCFLRTKFSR